MKKTVSVLFLSLTASVCLSSPAPAAYYQADFQTGAIPKDMTVEDLSDNEAVQTHYRHGYTTDGWTVDRLGKHGYCALCPTHDHGNTPRRSRMITPDFDVTSADAFVRWQARSVMPEFPEAYRIMAVEEGSTAAGTLFETDCESSQWVTRVASLSAYNGKRIHLIIEATSINRYMLAIGNLYIGELSDNSFQVTDRTRRFVGCEEVYVEGTAVNTGGRKTAANIILTDGTGKEVAQFNIPGGVWETGEAIQFSLPAEPALNKTFSYSVSVPFNDGTSAELAKGKIYRSHYPRRHLLDKGTGMWCPNCPQGSIVVEEAEQKYGESLITVETHAYPDMLMQADYWTALDFYAAPYFKMNRDAATAASDGSKFDAAAYTPAIARIDFTGATIASDGRSVTLKTETEFADATDNTTDSWRIGYVVTRDYYDPSPESTLYQENGSSMYTADRFYFLPRIIPSDLAVHKHVSLTGDIAFKGIANSIPGNIAAGTPNEYSWTLELPEAIETPEQARIVAYILNTETGHIANAAQIQLNDIAGTDTALADRHETVSIAAVMPGKCTLRFGSDCHSYLFQAVSPDGKLLAETTGNCSGETEISLNGIKGLVILKVICDNGESAALKTIMP